MRVVGGIDEAPDLDLSRTGFSVTGMCQGVLLSSIDMDSPFMVSFSINASGRVLTAAASGVFGTGRSAAGSELVSGDFGRPDAKLHHEECVVLQDDLLARLVL